jgi:LysM repeat protein
VNGRPQSYNLSCESRSAVDFAAFFGATIEETEFLRRLPRSDNPDAGFVGNANGRWGQIPPASYGVHAAPVAQLLRDYGVPAVARRGLDWDKARREIAAGRPLLVWVIGNVWPGAAQPYTAEDGHSTLVAPYEHTMLLTGYDPSTVTLVNAGNGREARYPLSDFLASWATLGNMAVAAAPDLDAPAGPRYTVQAGDTLLSIAARLGLSWYELALLNGLDSPNVIYAGQELALPGGETTAVTPTPTPPPAPPTPPPTAAPPPEPATYTVQPGDHLMQIARELGLEWRAIAERNGLTPPDYVVHPGQMLRLPGAGEASHRGETAVSPSPSPFPPPTAYLVQPGDTLFSIASRFGLSWQALARHNGVAYPYKIYVGQQIELLP